MKFRKWEIALIATAVALLVPLLFSWANYLAPLLAVLGVVLAGAVLIYRTSMEKLRPREAPPRVSLMPEGKVVVEPVMGELISSSRPVCPPNRTQDVLPVETQHNWLMRKWLSLWNCPDHGTMLLWCALVILFPLDDMVPIGITWADDILAMVLFVKHSRDIYKLKWGKSPERMMADQAKTLMTTEARRGMASRSGTLLSQRRPARSS